ncbi:MAG: MoaD family protein [Dehalococcoidia bacterium]|jgi:sulfur-carrier protein|nr:MoaD family protein [Dehalococcoidia bacterium]
MIEAKLYATFRVMADGNKTVEIDELEGGSTVGAVLEELVVRFPDLREGFFDDEGAIRSYVAVMVNGRDIRHLGGVDSVIDDGATLDIFPPVAGGDIFPPVAGGDIFPPVAGGDIFPPVAGGAIGL